MLLHSNHFSALMYDTINSHRQFWDRLKTHDAFEKKVKFSRWAPSWSQCTGSQPTCDFFLSHPPVVGCHYFPPGLRLYLINVHQMAPPLSSRTSNYSWLLIYWPREDESLLTSSGRFTHICGHPSTEGWACDRESSPAKDRRSATVPRHQPTSEWLTVDYKIIYIILPTASHIHFTRKTLSWSAS